jgi:hypothetical protein
MGHSLAVKDVIVLGLPLGRPGADVVTLKTNEGAALTATATVVDRDEKLILANWQDGSEKWHPIEVEVTPGKSGATMVIRDDPGEVEWTFGDGSLENNFRSWRSGHGPGSKASEEARKARKGNVWEPIPANQVEGFPVSAAMAKAREQAPGTPSMEARVRMIGGYFSSSSDPLDRLIGKWLDRKAALIRQVGASTVEEYQDRIGAMIESMSEEEAIKAALRKAGRKIDRGPGIAPDAKGAEVRTLGPDEEPPRFNDHPV